jgi:hypothetical protein
MIRVSVGISSTLGPDTDVGFILADHYGSAELLFVRFSFENF